ncbi:hypothetical protein THAOC_16837, partial [Thalassiosira oceanica]
MPPARSPVVSPKKNNDPPQPRPPARPTDRPPAPPENGNKNVNSMKPFTSPAVGRQAEAVDDDMQARWRRATLRGFKQTNKMKFFTLVSVLAFALESGAEVTSLRGNSFEEQAHEASLTE